MVLVEHHEDVVVVRPADEATARFYFHQVKDVSGKSWTAKDLIRRKKANKALGNSVLGKLVQGTHSKPFSARLEAIFIVATCGFSLEQKDVGQNYEELAFADLSDAEQKKLSDAVHAELGHAVDLKDLRLLKPKLGSDYRAGTIASIVELINLRFPGAKSNPTYIYTALIDELHRRGVVPYDYQSWEKLLGEKALTGSEVEKTLTLHCDAPQSKQIEQYIDQVGLEMGFGVTARMALATQAQAYYHRRAYTKSLEQIQCNERIRTAVNNAWAAKSDKLKELAEEVKSSLDGSTRSYLISLNQLDAAIACEIILKSTGA